MPDERECSVVDEEKEEKKPFKRPWHERKDGLSGVSWL